MVSDLPSNTEGERPRPVSLEERHPDLPTVLLQFHRTVDALRGMLDEFVPHVRQQDRDRFGPKALANVRSLSPDQRRELQDRLAAQIEKSRIGAPSTDEDLREMLRHVLGADIREVFEGDRHSMVSYLLHVSHTIADPDQATLILNSLLAQGISALEVLVSGVATRHFIAHPKALDADAKALSLSDVRDFKDADDPADLLISREVTSMIYGNLDDWAAWFKKRCNVSFQQLALDWGTLGEAFQRRHIILHNGGNVSRQYLSRVPGSDATLRVGDPLPVDEEYLRAALDQIDVFGSLLVVKAWGTWHPSERDASAGHLLQRSYDLMLRERWPAVTALTKAGCDMRCSAKVLEPIKVNGWHSRAQTDGYESIHAEVSAWDVSAAADRFRLVQFALLEQYGEAETLVIKLIKRGEISRGELNEWPVLAKLRTHIADKGVSLPGAGTQTSTEEPMDR